MDAVLLLGGRSAIGLAIVEELLRTRGAHDVLLAQRPGGDPDGFERQRRRLQAAGAGQVLELDFDATDLGSHEALLERAFAGRRVSHAVVAFGILGDQEQAWREVAAAQRLVQVNTTAAVGVGVGLGRLMTAQGGGDIIAVSSVAGVRVRRANLVYGASKAGMDAFYLALGDALARDGGAVVADERRVRVLVVRPGAVRSPMIAGRPRVALTVDPGDVARAAVATLGRRRVVHVPRVFGPVMSASSLLPAPLWARITRVD